MSQELHVSLLGLLSGTNQESFFQGLELLLSLSPEIQSTIIEITHVSKTKLTYVSSIEDKYVQRYLALFLYAEHYTEYLQREGWEPLEFLQYKVELSWSESRLYRGANDLIPYIGLPENLGLISSLVCISVAETRVCTFPASIEQLSNLQELHFENSGIDNLELIPEALRNRNITIWSLDGSSEYHPCIVENNLQLEEEVSGYSRSKNFLVAQIEEYLKHPCLELSYTWGSVEDGTGEAMQIVVLKDIQGKAQHILRCTGSTNFGAYCDEGFDAYGYMSVEIYFDSNNEWSDDDANPNEPTREEAVQCALEDLIVDELGNGAPSLSWSVRDQFELRPDAMYPQMSNLFGEPDQCDNTLVTYAKEGVRKKVLASLDEIEARLKEVRLEWEKW
jgi:hypothetical protein